ncbi:MAG: hypothetical protein WC634_03325 [archaeon]
MNTIRVKKIVTREGTNILRAEFRKQKERRRTPLPTPTTEVLLKLRRARVKSIHEMGDDLEAANAYRRSVISIALEQAGVRRNFEEKRGRVIAALEPSLESGTDIHDACVRKLVIGGGSKVNLRREKAKEWIGEPLVGEAAMSDDLRAASRSARRGNEKRRIIRILGPKAGNRFWAWFTVLRSVPTKSV